LAQSCLARSRKLAALGRISHQDDGRGPGVQALVEGLPPGVYGEVLAAGKDPLQVWKAWLDSATHRAVLADPRWESWGWGATGSGETTVWVVRFWRP